MAGAPSARSGAAWVWSGTELLLFGGRPGGSGATNAGHGYDPFGGKWRTLSGVNAPEPRYDAFAVWLGDRALFWGGRDGGGSALDTGGRYDPASDAWVAMPSGGVQRRSAPAGRTGWAGFTGPRALVAGGLDNAQNPRTDGRLYDPVANDWPAGELISIWPSGLDHEYGVGVWSGVELILWSGLDGNTLVDVGERYLP
jgi:hypothetical protein